MLNIHVGGGGERLLKPLPWASGSLARATLGVNEATGCRKQTDIPRNAEEAVISPKSMMAYDVCCFLTECIRVSTMFWWVVGKPQESSVTSSRLERGKSQARTQQDQGLNLASCTLELLGLELDNLQARA